MNNTITVSGIPCTIDGYVIPIAKGEYRVTAKPAKSSTPLVSVPMMGDYKWQQECLKDRLEHPEKYANSEDVEATIKKLRKWLAEHEDTQE